MMAKWEKSGDTCPKCEGETEHKIGIDDEGCECDQGERCSRCRWIVDFEADSIQLAWY